MNSVPDPLLGAVIDGRYLIHARIARGGMATVYRGTDQRLDRDVAVKIMHPHLADQDEFVQRFHREALAAARLSHPNVVAVYDEGAFASESSETAYLIMEHISGPDLRTELGRRGSFPLGMALEIVRQVLSALGTAHSAGLIHRDVKPENVLLVRGDEVTAKVTDFGLARAVAAARATTAGTVLGTVAYLAPEVLEEQATARSDIYSAGVMLYELIAGHAPFSAETPIALAYKHVNDPMPRLSTIAPWIPASVDSLIGVLTAKDPAHRPADGNEARDRVQGVLADLDPIVAKRRIAVIPTTFAEREPDGPRNAGPHDTRSFTPAHRTALLTAPPARQSSRGHEIARQRSGANRTPSSTSSKVWRWAITLLLIAATAAGIAWYFTAGPGMRISLPDVTGRDEDAAVTIIEEVNLVPQLEYEHSDDVPDGRVISTDPAAPAQLSRDDTVTLTVSLGIEQVAVPAVVGLPLETAEQQLRDARLVPEVEEQYSASVPAGSVIAQSVPATTEVDHSTPVTIVVSLGREPVEAVDVRGLSFGEAAAALESAGITVDRAESYSDTVEEGAVISQSQLGTVYRGDTVTLTVSLGPELFEVPDVFGLQRDDAAAILEDAGFEVEYDNFLGGIFGTVRDQSIAPGEMHPAGTVIVLTIV
ncbi:Stk1 family PASTA domain-containing Ser/Thr kinase [Flaviflexus salsibiostraticola]|uniref:Stk1 family PASTA domain-containing Ser/Thr kinase n=1 Tax=Flaviflexus salsibiostraticola TaxID=1282737 RepID=UPI0013DDD310|nr:Stk1 family PASTA domain-containing Ser/Thr kinase [Flaviflexus salsibiostraticola]